MRNTMDIGASARFGYRLPRGRAFRTTRLAYSQTSAGGVVAAIAKPALVVNFNFFAYLLLYLLTLYHEKVLHFLVSLSCCNCTHRS